VIAEAADGRDALDAVRRLRPRLIVLDIHLPILGGIDVVQRIASFEFNVVPIAFTSRTDRLSVVRMLKAGARGIVPKAAAATELVHAVEVVMRGQTYLSPSIAEIISRLATRADRGADLKPAADLLSTRETEVLQGIALGKQNKEIADELQVAVRTIESHRSQLMRKLDLRSVAALTKYAIREGLASIEH
jgi:DNA-binding NarL/FixJ family response regulator